MNPVHAYNNLLSLKRIFDSLNTQFWLDEGTALGAWRGNDFIEGDGDIDIGFLGECDYILPQLMEELKSDGWHYFNLNEHPCGEGKQLSCIRLNISVDISLYYLRGDKRWRCMFDRPPNKEVRYFACVYPKSLYDNLVEINFLEAEVPFLVPPKEFLVLQYGNWEVPDPNFRWQWDYKSQDLQWEFTPKDQKNNQQKEIS